MRNVNAAILSAPDTQTQIGSAIDTNQMVSASFMAVFGDSTVGGQFAIQASNDISKIGYLPQDFTPVNWVTLQTQDVSAGAPALISVPQMCYRWVRAVFTYASGGSSTVTVNMNGLSI